MNPRLHGLYAITDQSLIPEGQLLDRVTLALEGGCAILQYRDKSDNATKRRADAQALLELCHTHNALFIINDDLDLAAEIGADGVHMGKDDKGIAEARKVLGAKAIIGISCYNQLEQAKQAQAAGADYVAFGRFFPSNTKPLAVQAEISLLREAKQALDIPMVAIGGITPENGAQLVQAGADMLAVIQGVFAQPDIRQACHRFTKIFEDAKQ